MTVSSPYLIIWHCYGRWRLRPVAAAVTVVAPAIGNAVFNAVGARVRGLPITAEAVKAAMKA